MMITMSCSEVCVISPTHPVVQYLIVNFLFVGPIYVLNISNTVSNQQPGITISQSEYF